jgi:hypothetical protein
MNECDFFLAFLKDFWMMSIVGYRLISFIPPFRQVLQFLREILRGCVHIGIVISSCLSCLFVRSFIQSSIPSFISTVDTCTQVSAGYCLPSHLISSHHVSSHPVPDPNDIPPAMNALTYMIFIFLRELPSLLNILELERWFSGFGGLGLWWEVFGVGGYFDDFDFCGRWWSVRQLGVEG